MPKVTIVVPVYNVENFLHQCLDSIQEQTYKDFECILVDDASPDNCPRICDEFVEKDNRFKVIHKKKNEGLSAARKTGLNLVKTEYVTNVDSDDCLPCQSLELLMNAVNTSPTHAKTQIVIGSYYRVIGKKKLLAKVLPLKSLVEPLEYFFLFENNSTSMWGKLYRTELFKGVDFSPYQVGEDAITNVQVFAKVKNEEIKIIQEVVYNYRYNQVSIIGRLHERIYPMFELYPVFICKQWVGKYIKRLNVSDNVIKAYNKFLVGSMVSYLFNKNTIERNDLDKLLSYYRSLDKKKVSKKIRLFMWLYTYSPEIAKTVAKYYIKFTQRASVLHMIYKPQE